MKKNLKILLLRHGEAERDAHTDALRPLSPRGRAEVSDTVVRLVGLSLPAPRIFVSPLLRARQTGEIVAEIWNLPVPVMLEGITPDDDPREAAQIIARHCRAGETPVFATHMPLIASVTAWLESGRLNQAGHVPTGGAILLGGEVVGPGMMRVERRIFPGESDTGRQ